MRDPSLGGFPGLGADGRVIAPIDAAAWPPPAKPLAVDALVLVPKRELHVTLVGSALGRTLRAALDAGRLTIDDLGADYAAQDWSYTRSGEYVLLRKAPVPRADPTAVEAEDAGDAKLRHAVIEMIELPAMIGFHAALAARLGAPHPVPPPHVTLWVSEGSPGIALPDLATLARCSVRPLTRSEVAAAID